MRRFISIMESMKYHQNACLSDKKRQGKCPKMCKILPTYTKSKSKNIMRFETTFEQARIKCSRIQDGIRFKNCPDVQKMTFSWWQRFQADRGMRWKRICSNRKSFTNNEVEEERRRS